MATKRLPGTSFHANEAVDVVDRDGERHELVLRRWARPGWEETDAEFHAAREAGVLRMLASTGVPAPRLVAADPGGDRCGDPALLVTRLPGAPPGPPEDLGSFLAQIAEVMAAIHSVDAPSAAPYRRFCDPRKLRAPEATESPELWRRAIALAKDPPPPSRECLIHRDFHQGNTLWERGRLTGVVDWSYASLGPPAVDAAHLRWNLAVWLGPAVADEFVLAREAVTGEPLEHQAYWDAVDALDLVADPSRPAPFPAAELALVEQHLARALDRL